MPSIGSGALRLTVVTSAPPQSSTPTSVCETYATLLNRRVLVPSHKTDYVAVEKHHLVALLEPHVRQIHVDEGWYVAQYPDVQDAIRRGEITGAAEHYCRSGYYEHRLPYPIEVDEPWYLAEYSDIREAVDQGAYPSGAAHFFDVGFREGRMPRAHFTLQTA